MAQTSSFYVGSVMHRRFKPRAHHLRYRSFWMLIDLDEVDALDRRLWLFSRGRFNVMSVFDSDHGNGTSEPLRTQIDRLLQRAGIETGGGAVRLFCMPRILGHGFNPLSIFFCYDRAGDLVAIVYEVHNTFSERHSYVVPIDRQAHADDVHHGFAKQFYVSPFLKMDMTYRFQVTPPVRRIAVGIHAADAEGVTLVASLEGTQVALSDRTVLRLLLTHPLLTLKVVGAIHWHALRLWWKGLPVHTHRPPTEDAITIVDTKA